MGIRRNLKKLRKQIKAKFALKPAEGVRALEGLRNKRADRKDRRLMYTALRRLAK